NYDYPPELMDCVILRSRFLDRTVVGTADGVWGLCDGMNDRGLAVSLTFGGRVAVGDGFGMPLVIRYLLETCETVQQGREVLTRLPYAQPYNLTLADASGDVVTAYLGPDRPASFRRLPVATNHQWAVETFDPMLAASSVEREWWLLRLLDDPDVDAAIFSDRFLQAPLYSFGHAEGVGTVYTAEYVPNAGTVRHRWPDQDWVQSLERFDEGERAVTFPAPLLVPPAI
ncbi:MAG TPA: C45 family peptidase, partial [Actinomycetota bacterium]|nr:C45 family peptidase [Actinomycetota bacterium]